MLDINETWLIDFLYKITIFNFPNQNDESGLCKFWFFLTRFMLAWHKQIEIVQFVRKY
ncbi:hypothetical protein [uncultured Methanobrevibacter sp.]|uniref:hypothetical protein n=1 Tax=uncultured Methanobrevibacter sp. TaxID=253161 RepID=UPI002609A640